MKKNRQKTSHVIDLYQYLEDDALNDLSHKYRDILFWRRFRSRSKSSTLQQWSEYFLRLCTSEAEEIKRGIEYYKQQKTELG